MRKCRLKSCRKEIPPRALCINAYQFGGFCGAACSQKHEQEKRRGHAKRQRESAKSRTARVSAKPKKKAKTVAKLRNEVAELLQKLVRLKAADSNGYVQCSSCENKYHWKEMQGGHFIERGKHSTMLLEENIHPQCQGCNGFGMKYKSSVVLAYRRFMVDMYGEKFVKWLELEANQPCKHKRAELESLKSEVRARINELERSI